MAYDKKSKKDNDAKLEAAKKEYQAAKDHWNDNYNQASEDLMFLYGENQWPENTRKNREALGQPCLTLNQMLPYAHQVINDIRQSRPAIRVTPVDDNADIETAEIYQGIIRSIERASKADVAYDTASQNSIGGGIGWILITTDYEDEYSFDQEIFIERVLDFSSVVIDPASVALDGSDAEYGYVKTDYTYDDFCGSFPNSDTAKEKAKTEKDKICVFTRYYKDYEKTKIYKTKYGTLTQKELDEFQEEFGAELDILDERETSICKVKWMKYTDNEILDTGEWAGKYIPIVPVIGDEAYIDGKRVFRSLINPAKDAQRMFNYWKSASTEIFALQPRAPWVGAIGQFASTPSKWAASNSQPIAFLEYDPVTDDETGQLLPPPQRQMPPQGSPAMLQEATNAVMDIKNALGMHEATLGAQGNEISGVAIRNRQIYGDNANYHFMDNLAAAITQVGNILVDLIPKIYSTRTVMRILGIDGTEETVPVNVPYVVDANTGQKRQQTPQEREQNISNGKFDLVAGKYDVVCDVGASYSSKRQEFADKMIELAKAEPRLMEIGGDLLIASLDLPNAKELSERIKAMMPPEVLGEDPQAAKLQAAAQQVAQLQEQLMNMDAALQDKKKNEAFEQQAKLAEIQNDRAKLQIDAQKAQAEIQKIYAEIKKTQVETVNDTTKIIEDLASRMDDMQQAFEILIGDMENGIEIEVEKSEPEQKTDAMLETEDDSEND